MYKWEKNIFKNKKIGEVEILVFLKEMQISLPEALIELLMRTNGAQFDDKIYYQNKSNNFALSDVLSTGSDSVNSIGYACEVLNDVIDTNVFIPFIRTWSGDFFLCDSEKQTIHYWDHEQDGIVEVCGNMQTFLSSIKVDTSETELETLERICRTCRLEELSQHILYEAHKNGICEIAAREGNLDLVKDCLKANLNEGNMFKNSAVSGNFEITEFLISQGWDINSIQTDGRRILDWVKWKPEYFDRVKKLGGISSKE